MQIIASACGSGWCREFGKLENPCARLSPLGGFISSYLRNGGAVKGAIVLLLLFSSLSLARLSAQDASVSAPLVTDQKSHVIMMEYENWFGPKAVTFQGAVAMPFLQSADMQAIGGGYDSADPVVIKTHLEWFEYLGMDAALLDLTNNVSCIFNSEWFIQKYLSYCTPAFRLQNETIRNNTGNTYPAWNALGTRLKLVPLLGGSMEDVLYLDIDGKTSFEKEIDYFGSLIAQYPNLAVIYKGKPLMLIFVGAAQDPDQADNPEWFQVRKFLSKHPEVGQKYTFREMAGYLDSQPYLWAPGVSNTGPEQIDPRYGFWSWVDRMNPNCNTPPYCPYFPTYNVAEPDIAGSRVENFTASIATAGQQGWWCPTENPPFCSDDGLRYGPDGSYLTFAYSMQYATQLDPIFLIIHQFNEFVPPDEGLYANSDDDIEPANQYGNDLAIVKQQIEAYRQHETLSSASSLQ
jgi:hypothetical protein